MAAYLKEKENILKLDNQYFSETLRIDTLNSYQTGTHTYLQYINLSLTEQLIQLSFRNIKNTIFCFKINMERNTTKSRTNHIHLA